jgi:hypothetical protein
MKRSVQPPTPKPVAITPPKPTGKSKPPKIVRPSAPALSQAPSPGASTNAPATIPNIDDDDAVIVPAPAPEVFAHRPAPPRVRRQPFYQQLAFRRTIIPILLTMSVALPACAVWWFMQGQDSPIRSLGLKFPITFLVLGLISLGLAIANMLHVKHELARAAER